MRAHLTQVRAIAANDFRYLLLDPVIIITVVMMPLVVSLFISPVFELALQDQGFETATGAEQAIPGVAVMFSFFLVTFTGYAVFREHGWNTWDRLRSLGIPKWVLLAGKGVPSLGGLLLQQAVVFLVGAAMFGVDVFGNVGALFLLAVCFGLALIGLALLLVTLLRSVQQMGAIGNLLSILLGGLGGALAPVELLPGPVQAISRFTPSYWAVDGYRDVLLAGSSVRDIAANCLALLAMAVVALALAARRFDDSEVKVAWA